MTILHDIFNDVKQYGRNEDLELNEEFEDDMLSLTYKEIVNTIKN